MTYEFWRWGIIFAMGRRNKEGAATETTGKTANAEEKFDSMFVHCFGYRSDKTGLIVAEIKDGIGVLGGQIEVVSNQQEGLGGLGFELG